MPHLISKICISLLSAVLVLTFLTANGHAAVNSAYQTTCTELESTSWQGAPSPMAIICPVARLLNVFVLSAGAFFVIYVFMAAIKYALAQGDPKALQSSQQTLTTAVIGFLVVIGVYTILTIVKNVLGLQDNPIIDPFGALSTNLAKLLEKMGIEAP